MHEGMTAAMQSHAQTIAFLSAATHLQQRVECSLNGFPAGFMPLVLLQYSKQRHSTHIDSTRWQLLGSRTPF